MRLFKKVFPERSANALFHRFFFLNWSVMFAGVYQQSYLPSHDRQL